MPSPVVFFQIQSADPQKARAFYSELFDWQFGEATLPGSGASINPQGPADFDVQGSFFPLPAGAPPSVTLFFRVNDLQMTVPKAESLGARVVVPITQLPGGTHVAIIVTPEGHSIGIVQA